MNSWNRCCCIVCTYSHAHSLIHSLTHSLCVDDAAFVANASVDPPFGSTAILDGIERKRTRCCCCFCCGCIVVAVAVVLQITIGMIEVGSDGDHPHGVMDRVPLDTTLRRSIAIVIAIGIATTGRPKGPPAYTYQLSFIVDCHERKFPFHELQSRLPRF